MLLYPSTKHGTFLAKNMENSRMKILHVIPFHPSPSSFIFAKRQVEDLSGLGHINEVFYFNTSFSLIGFYRQLMSLRSLVKRFNPDVIHAHYGTINAFFASFIKNVPLVVSFHGSDLNYTKDVHWFREKLGKRLSRIAAQRAQHIICVSAQLQAKLPIGKEKSSIISSGVNTEHFKELDRSVCKSELKLSDSKNYLFFNANNPIVKRLDIALETVDLLKDLQVELLTLKGDTDPAEIPVYLNASVAVLLCSDSEGSPMVIKEAMACGVPIISTDVGDVKSTIAHVDNCFIIEQKPTIIAEKVRGIIVSQMERTNGLEQLKMLGLDQGSVVKKVESIYHSIIQKGDKWN
jgi:teichuronic acid biosynthesis glycosyltransferase TuaC